MEQGRETATLAGGCFWCLEAAFERLLGVEGVVSGYTGGRQPRPSYREVCAGETGHAEAVQVTFDPAVISYRELLEVFFSVHDPTTLNRQGADEGPQYRSVVFYADDSQKKTAEASKTAAQANFDKPIVTEITKATDFYPAENYHQNYYFQNKSKNGYCRVVIEPKLKKLKLEH